VVEGKKSKEEVLGSLYRSGRRQKHLDRGERKGVGMADRGGRPWLLGQGYRSRAPLSWGGERKKKESWKEEGCREEKKQKGGEVGEGNDGDPFHSEGAISMQVVGQGLQY